MLVDTSAWIDYLQHAGTSTSLAVRRALRRREAATTDIVLMEVLAGTTDATRLASWERLLSTCEFIAQKAFVDAAAAAHLYRSCRRAGETPRNLTDCMVAAVALRNSVQVLHRDRDYDVIARHSGLMATRG